MAIDETALTQTKAGKATRRSKKAQDSIAQSKTNAEESLDQDLADLLKAGYNSPQALAIGSAYNAGMGLKVAHTLEQGQKQLVDRLCNAQFEVSTARMDEQVEEMRTEADDVDIYFW